MPANLENSAVVTGLEKVSFHSNIKERQCQKNAQATKHLLSFHMLPSSIQFSLVAQLCRTLCDPMNRSTPGLPVHHQLSEFNQTHAHQVRDAIQPSHPLVNPSPPAPNPSQHQGLFQ